MAQLTYKFVKEQFEKEGYTLLSDECKNSKQKLDYICSKGHKRTISWGSFQQGKRCKICSHRMPDIKYIKKSFEKEGYKLLSTEYVNNHSKLDYICSKGHRHTTAWNKWQQGGRCPYCSGNVKVTIEFIRSEFEKEGYILLTKVYKNNKQKLDYICPEGHEHSIRWDNWGQGKRCQVCARNIQLTLCFIKKELEKEGYKLLTTEYKNNLQKLECICPVGHECSIRWGTWQQGNRCLKCSGNDKKTIKFISDVMKKEGYTLLSTEYQNAHSRLYVECPKGHRYYVMWNNWQQGKRCPSCPSKVSKWELEVKEYIKDLNIPFLSNDRSELTNQFTKKPMELDIWFPQINRAIECNGVYWHGTKKAIERDKIKLMLCKDLLILNDIEWGKDKLSCKHKIRNFITTKGAK
jgi:hypothetical protein